MAPILYKYRVEGELNHDRHSWCVIAENEEQIHNLVRERNQQWRECVDFELTPAVIPMRFDVKIITKLEEFKWGPQFIGAPWRLKYE